MGTRTFVLKTSSLGSEVAKPALKAKAPWVCHFFFVNFSMYLVPPYFLLPSNFLLLGVSSEPARKVFFTLFKGHL